MSTYVPPPPPTSYGPPKQNTGCLKWGAAGCGGCLLLAIIAGFLIWKAVGSFVGTTLKDSMQVAIDMESLHREIKQYKADTGKYPDKLADLVPKYVSSPAKLKLTTHPEGPDFTYYKPGPDAQPTDPLLAYTLSIKTPDGEKMDMPITLLINGRTRNGRAGVVPGSETPPRGSPNKKPAGSETG
jgi:hypothetical protein